MPELPEVETVRRGLEPYLTGARILSARLNRPDLRFVFPPGFAAGLEGRTITHLGRRAKYLLFTLSDGAVWLTHLGMTGSFSIAGERPDAATRYHAPGDGTRHLHVSVALHHPRNGSLTLDYTDARRFGFMGLFPAGAANPHLDGLGPEPLGNALDAPGLGARLAGRRTPIKSALLDQRVVAGLGNIYVCEALFRAGIAPTRLAGTLSAAEAGHLVSAIRAVLEDALAAGGSTLRDFRGAEGRPGYFQHAFDVYDREGAPCAREGCEGTIVRLVQSGRSSFFCPVCQR